MNWTAGEFLVSGDADRRVFTKDNRGDASIKALLFVGLAFFCLFALALISVFAGKSADDVLSPKRNHVGFLWAVLSGSMLVILPIYLVRVYKPPISIEMHRADRSVRSAGSIVTRFERIEFFEVLEDRDNDGQKVYRLTMFYGDGRELLIERSYDGAGVQALAREMSEFSESRLRLGGGLIVT